MSNRTSGRSNHPPVGAPPRTSTRTAHHLAAFYTAVHTADEEVQELVTWFDADDECFTATVDVIESRPGEAG